MAKQVREGSVLVALGSERKAALDAFCEAQGATVSDAIREAVDRHLAYPPVPPPPPSLTPLPPSSPPPATGRGRPRAKSAKKSGDAK